jgi:hypothetical protein
MGQFTPDPPIPEEHTLKALGEETFAGRLTLRVEETRPDGMRVSRLWVDAITGVILRRVMFSREAPNFVLSEAAITAIVYDQDLPAALFNPATHAARRFAIDFTGRPLPPGQDLLSAGTPWPGNGHTPLFAIDFTGRPLPPMQDFLSAGTPWPGNGHTPLAALPVPQDLDPALHPLFLQWPERWDENKVIVTLEGTAFMLHPAIQVFAARYPLGSLPLEEVSFRACRRSPDGRRVALSVNEGEPFSPGRLVWFSLDAPQDLHQVYDLGFGESVFAFSPDNRRLAFLGCRPNENCGIFIQDLETGNRASLGSPMFFPETLLWSPDGKRLGIVFYISDEPPYRDIQIIDIAKEREIYYGPLQNGIYFPLESPTQVWQIKLPPPGEIEAGCMLP